MEHATTLVTLGIIFSFFMAWGVGANDVANAMGTSVGAKVLTIFQALIIAGIFEAAGALLASGAVTHTIQNSIVVSDLLFVDPKPFVFGMLAALLSAGTWLALATYFAWPVSTTHSIIGAVIGFGFVGLDKGAIQWHTIINIFLSWVMTPIIAGVLAYLLFMSVYKIILDAASPTINLKRYLPIYVFLVAAIISLVVLTQGLQHLGFKLIFWKKAVLTFSIALVFSMISFCLIKIDQSDLQNTYSGRSSVSEELERGFGILTIFTACSLAFAHGSNDAANAIGPLAAIVGVAQQGHTYHNTGLLPLWIPIFGAIGIITGLATCGYRVIETVGSDITLLTPSRAFSAQLATAVTVVLASGLGLPISTTQTLVGAILGVGFARGITALNLRVIGNIFMSWVITLPAGAFMSVLFFYLIRTFFS